MKPTLEIAANSHLTMNFGAQPDSLWRSVSQRLELEYGFSRSGPDIIGANERIHRSYQGPGFRLLAGWDNWSGHYLLSESAAGDEFIKKLLHDIGA